MQRLKVLQPLMPINNRYFQECRTGNKIRKTVRFEGCGALEDPWADLLAPSSHSAPHWLITALRGEHTQRNYSVENRLKVLQQHLAKMYLE